MLRKLFPCLREQATFVAETNCFWKSQKHFFFSRKQKSFPNNVGCAHKTGTNIQGNDVYAAMFPCLRGLYRLRTGSCILVNIQSFSYFSKYRLKGQPASFSPRRAEVNCSSFLETNKIRLRKPYTTIYEQEARRTDLSHKPRTFLHKSLLHQLPES